MSNYDTWLQPREGSGMYDATCKAKPASCHDCGYVVPEPPERTCHGCREAIPRHAMVWEHGPEVGYDHRRIVSHDNVTCARLAEEHEYHAAECPRCGSEQYGPDECGETWQCTGNWNEALGVELARDGCPRCTHAGDKIVVDEAEPPEPYDRREDIF